MKLPIILSLSLMGCALFEPEKQPEDLVTTVRDDTALAYFDGKPIRLTDLPLSAQEEIATVEQQRYEKILRATQERIIELYIERESKAKNVPKDKMRADLFSAKFPTDDEAKKYYTEHKSEYPYDFNLVKSEIKRMLFKEQTDGARKKILDKIAGESGTSFALKQPSGPKYDINQQVMNFPYLTKGNGNADLVLVQFVDYLCPHCKEAEPSIQKLAKEHGDKVRIVVIDYALGRNQTSQLLGRGGFCAFKLGKYPEYREKAMGLFETPKYIKDTLPTKIGIKPVEWARCLESPEAHAHMAFSDQMSFRLGVNATPTFFWKGRKIGDIKGVTKDL